MTYSIDEFWKSRISTRNRREITQVSGWEHGLSQISTFVEAPIVLSANYGDADPALSSIILVSAPGAVGKTTLARQIAAITGAVFVDLAQADPVGANTLVGGLARSGLHDSFERGETAVLIDGLDEARMRVTQESMAAFMKDVVMLAARDRNPIILLGRTGAIQEAWLWLSEEGVEAPVLEIGYFGNDQAAEFVKTQIQDIRGENHRREPDGRAVDLMLSHLRDATPTDGGAFSGYSPVLVALARRIAAETNTGKLISGIEHGEEVLTLEGITDAIMRREQGRLAEAPIQFDDQRLNNSLYSKEEQLARLVNRIYGVNLDVQLPEMSPEDQGRYDTAVVNWFEEHPFLRHGNHSNPSPSSVVFAGLLAAHALDSPSARGGRTGN